MGGKHKQTNPKDLVMSVKKRVERGFTSGEEPQSEHGKHVQTTVSKTQRFVDVMMTVKCVFSWPRISDRSV